MVFTNPRNGWNVEITCLADSGSNAMLLDSKLARNLHLDWKAGKERTLQVIKEIPIVGYSHKLMMQLENDSHQFEVDCIFVENLNLDGILGQTGFFDNYQVVFEGYNQRFEVTPIKTF
jgi:hypothetical protein